MICPETVGIRIRTVGSAHHVDAVSGVVRNQVADENVRERCPRKHIDSVSAAANTELTTYFTGSAFTSTGSVFSNPSAGRLQVSVSGAYFFTFGVCWTSGTSSNVVRYIWLAVNGNSAVKTFTTQDNLSGASCSFPDAFRTGHRRPAA